MADPDLTAQSVPATEDEVRDDMLAIAAGKELPVSSWGAGQPWRVLLEACATVLSDVGLAVARIAKNAYIGRGGAAGLWLDKALASHYAERRLDPDITVGQVLLEDHGGGPHTITDGECVVGTTTGLQYRVISGGGTLPLNGSLPVVVRAFGVGGNYNVANGAITRVVTSLPTVTVSNPAVGTSGTWITNLGADQESDAAATARAPLKWATLATGSPASAYLFWALSTPGVTRAAVDDRNPDGPNTLRVYVDNAGSVATLQATLDEKAPDGTRATAMAATTQGVTITAVVYVERAYRTQAEADVTALLTELQNETRIGGSVVKAEVIERIMRPVGVTDVELASSWAGTPNIQLAANAIPQLTLALEWIEV